MIAHPWHFYTTPTQDRFIESLDVSEASKKELKETLNHIATLAYDSGYKDKAEESEDGS
jgi:hypothetical protein